MHGVQPFRQATFQLSKSVVYPRCACSGSTFPWAFWGSAHAWGATVSSSYLPIVEIRGVSKMCMLRLNISLGILGLSSCMGCNRFGKLPSNCRNPWCIQDVHAQAQHFLGHSGAQLMHGVQPFRQATFQLSKSVVYPRCS